ncbi:hypothetical protein RSOLAG22IIIB_06901 [Rhizoctonia solani]|uniref:Uncharacterized protein n=1 Tax=Rhizoctonia solani TaxID=456999 RepID=A0A0K6GHL1_9AGAM|nr:hypothetical protein RSOLAG22IIIB_06901 [Rhizoctonia solani]
MERLVEREAKYKHVRKHGHLFGDKHGCYFNPYTYSPINNKTFKRIIRPPGVSICRTSKPVHELMGLRDDYELRLEIGEMVRHASTLFQPKDIVLKPDECLSYFKHYSLAARMRIYKYMYIRFPFLYHFRTDSDKGNWVIDGICNSSIMSRNLYLKAKRLPTDFDLKQNISDSIENDESMDELEEPEIPSGYEDDYALYAGASRSNKRPCPSEIDAEASDDYNVDSRSPKKRRGGPEDSLPGSSVVRTKPTTGEVLDVDHGVVRRRAHRDVLGTPNDKTGRTFIAGSAGERDRCKHARIASTSRGVVKIEYCSDDEPVQHENHVFSVPELKPVLRPEGITETKAKNAESNGRNRRIDTQPAVEGPPPQSAPSAFGVWLSTITFGLWKW